MNTVDDDLIRDICSALDELTAGISETAPPPRSVGIATTVPDQPRRDRRRVVVLAAAIVALIATVAALVSLRRDDRAVGSDDTALEVAPIVTAGGPGRTHPVPPIPDGWEPLEWGNLRLSLPPDMSPFNIGNGCTTETTTDLEIVCGDESVRISSATTDTVTDQQINGLQVSWQAGDCTGCQSLVLPELGTKVLVRRGDDASANAILDTVGPSGTWRYGNETRPNPPADWKTVTFEGTSIRVPPHWAVQTVSNNEVSPCPGSVILNTVLLDSSDPTECPDSPKLMTPTDGVRMSLSKPPFDEQPLWPDQVVGSTEGTTASDPWVMMRVGYGVDPAIGLAILSSFNSPAIETSTTYDTVPLATDPYFAIGDSVMLGAQPLLEARGINTVADSSNDASAAIERLQHVKATSRISHGAVIQLGTNGSMTRQEYESVLAEVSDVPRVVVLTVHGLRPWIASNNGIIRSLPQTHPNVVVLDWDEFATEYSGHLANDGVHLGDDVSKDAYTNLILQALGLPVSASPRPVHTEQGTYVILVGDYPSTIASRFKVTFEDLLAVNGWTLQEQIVPEFPPPGTVIKIPPGWTAPETDPSAGSVGGSDLPGE